MDSLQYIACKSINTSFSKTIFRSRGMGMEEVHIEKLKLLSLSMLFEYFMKIFRSRDSKIKKKYQEKSITKEKTNSRTFLWNNYF